MAQYIYTGDSEESLMVKKEATPKFTDGRYRDVVIPLNETITPDTVYFVKFAIQEDKVYDTTYKIKLVTDGTLDNTDNHETIHTFKEVWEHHPFFRCPTLFRIVLYQKF